MHPLVRDLYKRVLIVGKDYPGALLSCARSHGRQHFPAFSVLRSSHPAHAPLSPLLCSLSLITSVFRKHMARFTRWAGSGEEEGQRVVSRKSRAHGRRRDQAVHRTWQVPHVFGLYLSHTCFNLSTLACI